MVQLINVLFSSKSAKNANIYQDIPTNYGFSMTFYHDFTCNTVLPLGFILDQWHVITTDVMEKYHFALGKMLTHIPFS